MMRYYLLSLESKYLPKSDHLIIRLFANYRDWYLGTYYASYNEKKYMTGPYT